ncbi:hypothetical protein PBI_BLUEBERRY_77 [Gordonia phage Blueberry]|uniref:Uncharacterized protein n=1 Tax=Gordonia phage Azula TaxID=2762397 RepID=A0A7G8LKW7_9CAUD|nr:hypothetical protein BH771_gp77 [Gordonia phage Blueberry]YP_010110004.1 hypothetical protein KNV23_gp78 [Gordonia phage Azula]QGJ97452.1 hypothetical protein SEA_GAMBINO_80 [Gordonia phage Gambino]QZD97510.1 hypothetical protein SEA_MISSRONA_78 [Gordonia phage MissRona]ANA85539.1 hypothetical protein PBI_BLUEBERRY_77 [Gordonia phage Blueberry]QNJ57889.1 hypothetical protein SEA_AZULA_78 [Gordonia phage Azula]
MKPEKRSKVVAVDTSDSAESPIEWRIHVMRHPEIGLLPPGSPHAEDVPTDALRALLAFAVTGLALSDVAEASQIVRDELARHDSDTDPVAGPTTRATTVIATPTIDHLGPNDTVASVYRRAAWNLENGYEPGGGNVKASIARTLRSIADAEEVTS